METITRPRTVTNFKIDDLSKEDRFIYCSINTNCDKHIPWDMISESLRAVWRKIYREKNGIKPKQSY